MSKALPALVALALLAACGGRQPPILREVRPAPAEPPAARALAGPADVVPELAPPR